MVEQSPAMSKQEIESRVAAPTTYKMVGVDITNFL